MNANPIRSLVLIFAAMLFSGCGSSMYVNSSYTFQDTKAPAIALLPVVSKSNPLVADSLFEGAFEDISTKYAVEYPSRIRMRVEADTQLAALVQTLSSVEYDLSSNTPAPSLQSAISSTGLAALHELLPNSTVLLVPALFSLKNAVGTVMGKTTFRLYDLESGVLIYQDFKSINVGPGGTLREGGLLTSLGAAPDANLDSSPEARYCTALLAAHGVSSFKSNYLNKGEQ